MFACDKCDNVYKYKRNLYRHEQEKHKEIDYYNCTQLDCRAKFIRRGYLQKHLNIIHHLDLSESRTLAVNTRRGNPREDNYYSSVSEDDTILDIVAEMETVREPYRVITSDISEAEDENYVNGCDVDGVYDDIDLLLSPQIELLDEFDWNSFNLDLLPSALDEDSYKPANVSHEHMKLRSGRQIRYRRMSFVRRVKQRRRRVVMCLSRSVYGLRPRSSY